MHSLENKIPPPLVALLLAVCMWFSTGIALPLAIPPMYRWPLTLVVLLAGAIFSFFGLIAFRRARTTVNPLKPANASSLVHSGIYRMTRNPMYVGLLLLLVAIAFFLSSPWSLLGPFAFYLYIGRFQIAPEERALEKLFGTEYLAYKAKVRRWL